MRLPDLLARLSDVIQHGASWKARCPAHDDQHASLSISNGHNGNLLVCCHAGCSFEQIVAALNLTPRDFAGDGHAGRLGSSLAVYDYCDETGTLLYQVCRFSGKHFRQRRPDGKNGWVWKLGDTRRVLYHLDRLKGTPAVVVVEGEKDCDRLWALDVPATTNSGGAGK